MIGVPMNMNKIIENTCCLSLIVFHFCGFEEPERKTFFHLFFFLFQKKSLLPSENNKWQILCICYDFLRGKAQFRSRLMIIRHLIAAKAYLFFSLHNQKLVMSLFFALRFEYQLLPVTHGEYKLWKSREIKYLCEIIAWSMMAACVVKWS